MLDRWWPTLPDGDVGPFQRVCSIGVDGKSSVKGGKDTHGSNAKRLSFDFLNECPAAWVGPPSLQGGSDKGKIDGLDISAFAFVKWVQQHD